MFRPRYHIDDKPSVLIIYSCRKFLKNFWTYDNNIFKNKVIKDLFNIKVSYEYFFAIL